MGVTASDDALLDFVGVMRTLRAQCGWKRGQTHRSLTRYLLEETHELLEALDSFDDDDHGDDTLLREELGDLLLQVVFHATIAEERGAFTMGDVASDVRDKMVRRNPHVYPPQGSVVDGQMTAAEITDQWERAKATEKQRDSLLEGLAPSLPALLYADKVVDRSARAGTPITVDPASPDLGDRLLALVLAGHADGTDPEQALRDAVTRHLRDT